MTQPTPSSSHSPMLHRSTFEYLNPTAEQVRVMAIMREAAATYAGHIQWHVPPGADRTYVLRKLREIAMWVNIAITRRDDGEPRAAPPMEA